MFSITKEFSFDAAHRLVGGYEGKCANVHGHTWKVLVTIEKAELDKFGFVRDFTDLKILKEWIDNNLDHAMLVSSEDSAMLAFLEKEEQKYYNFAGNPTSENVAREIHSQSRMHLQLSAVTVFETCTSQATYRP